MSDYFYSLGSLLVLVDDPNCWYVAIVLADEENQ